MRTLTPIDFTALQRRNKAYSGKNGSKISVIYEGKYYMLKFPPLPKLNKNMSYTNSCFSEYLGCQIYETIGIPVQKTMLGTFSANGTKKIVVACEDFTEPGIVLQDFASLKNQIIDSARNGYGTELSDILHTCEEQTAIDPQVLLTRFWDMFIVDAFIGNWDRHNGNWGFLYNTYTDELRLAPVFDCGSSLYPQADDEIMAKTIADRSERDLRIYEIPTSAIMVDNKKIKYFEFISSLQNEACNQALMRIVPRIDMAKIQELIETTPFISNLQKQFYLTMLTERKTRILDYALTSLKARTSHKSPSQIIEEIAGNAGMIIAGYAFTAIQYEKKVRVDNLFRYPEFAMLDYDGNVIETNMDAINLHIVKDYWQKDGEFLKL